MYPSGCFFTFSGSFRDDRQRWPCCARRLWRAKSPLSQQNNLRFQCQGLWSIEARSLFGVAVEACFFVFDVHTPAATTIAPATTAVQHRHPDQPLGYADGTLLADLKAFQRWRHLGGEDDWLWRSGLKHNCASVMELSETSAGLVNGLGEQVSLERTYLYPLVKTSIWGDIVSAPSIAGCW